MPKYSQLTLEQREVVALRRATGFSQQQIACEIGCNKSTISRELKRNRQASGVYTPAHAHRKSKTRRKRDCKLEKDTRAADFVRERLSEGWSPAMISGHLSLGIEDISYVCHEAIYGFIYSAKQKASRLYQLLVRKRKSRKIRGVRTTRNRIPDRTPIHERPPAIEERADIGHFECDYVICKNSQPLLVLHERKTRLTTIAKLAGRSAGETISTLTAMLKRFPANVRHTITFDNDLGFALHGHLKTMLGMQTYFCDPYASWQKGGVERSNGRIRYWIPKGADLSQYSEQDLKEIVIKLNSLPMKKLGWKSPLQVWLNHAKPGKTMKFA